MVENSNLGRRIVDAVSMFIVTVLSLLLLLYVGYGEGRRTYEQIELEKLTAQGYLIQNTIERFLRDDLPLKQFPGFATIARPLVDGLADVDAMAVYDHDRRQLFFVKDKSDPTLPPPSEAVGRVKRDIEIDKGDTHYQVVVPLRTRFETAGALVIMSRTDAVKYRLQQAFLPLLFLVVGLAAVFAVGITIAAPYLARTKVPWLQIAFGFTFMLMAAALVYTLTVLYFEGVKGKAETATSTFSQRFNDIVTFNLSVSDFDGIDKAVNEFRQLNGEVSEVGVIVNNSIRHSSNRASLNKPWVSDSGAYEFKVDSAAPAQGRQLSVAVKVPRTVVYERVQRSIKNFAALFIASIFLSGVFLQVAVSLQGARSAPPAPAAPAKDGAGGDIALILLKPLYFLGVFLDSLTYAFLPKFMQEAATASGMPVSFASVPFTAYYLPFRAEPDSSRKPHRAVRPQPGYRFRPAAGGRQRPRPGPARRDLRVDRASGARGHRSGTAADRRSELHSECGLARQEDPGHGDHRAGLPGRHAFRNGDRLAAGEFPARARRVRGRRRRRAGRGPVYACDAPAHRWKRAGQRWTACHDAATCGGLPERDHRRSVSQRDLLHRNSREGAADWRHQFCHSADPHTAAVPAGGHRAAHHALWAGRRRIDWRRIPPGRPQSQYPVDPVLGRRHERVGPHAGRTSWVRNTWAMERSAPWSRS